MRLLSALIKRLYLQAQRQLQRVRGMVQELAGATMPLAVVAAASKAPQQQPRSAALRGPHQPTRPAPAQRPPGPAELQQRFALVSHIAFRVGKGQTNRQHGQSSTDSRAYAWQGRQARRGQRVQITHALAEERLSKYL